MFNFTECLTDRELEQLRDVSMKQAATVARIPNNTLNVIDCHNDDPAFMRSISNDFPTLLTSAS